MNAVVPEARVALDPTLLREDVVVLALEVPDNLREAVCKPPTGQLRFFKGGTRGNERELVVNLVSESGRVDDGERDANAFLLKLCGTPCISSNPGPALPPATHRH